MNGFTRLPFAQALKMPLRDVLRGITTVADLMEEVLEPATSLWVFANLSYELG